MKMMRIYQKEALKNMNNKGLIIGEVKIDCCQGRFIWMILKEGSLIFLLMIFIFMIGVLKVHQET